MEIRILKVKITNEKLRAFAAEGFGNMVKAVVDIEQSVLALGGELHADANAKLLEMGSKQEHLWGINLYPDKPEKDRIEFISLINIRPSMGNRSMTIQDAEIRSNITDIVNRLIG